MKRPEERELGEGENTCTQTYRMKISRIRMDCYLKLNHPHELHWDDNDGIWWCAVEPPMATSVD